MIIKTTERLADFTREQIKESGMTHPQILKKINLNREKSGLKELKGVDSISHAIAKGKINESSRNGIRCEVLNILGFEASLFFLIKRQ